MESDDVLKIAPFASLLLTAVFGLAYLLQNRRKSQLEKSVQYLKCEETKGPKCSELQDVSNTLAPLGYTALVCLIITVLLAGFYMYKNRMF